MGSRAFCIQGDCRDRLCHLALVQEQPTRPKSTQDTTSVLSLHLTVFLSPSSVFAHCLAALSQAADIFAALCIRGRTWHGNRMQCHCSKEPSLVAMHFSVQIMRFQRILQRLNSLWGAFLGYALHGLRTLGTWAIADGGRELRRENVVDKGKGSGLADKRR